MEIFDKLFNFCVELWDFHGLHREKFYHYVIVEYSPNVEF